MQRIKFLMVGGFLGAGKTTTIARLAAAYQAQGMTVGIVTNDQAYDLVDTHTLRAKGFDVGEVPGACFCCKFDDLISTVTSMSDDKLPNIVIAEPVGSCTDLYATVIQPMRQLYGDRFELGPLVVLLKPEHGKKILGASGGRGFSPQAEYIFLKQLEEADAIVINKIDKLTDADQENLLSLIKQRFNDVDCFGISAREGSNFEQFVAATEQLTHRQKPTMEMDYETYAIGEAELGWLNCQVEATSDQKFELDALVLKLTGKIGDQLTSGGYEIAHLKLLGQTIENAAVANRVSSSSAAELSLASDIKTLKADLLVNARVATDPDSMVAIVKLAANEIGDEMQLALEVKNVQSFRPAKPEPTHRIVDDS